MTTEVRSDGHQSLLRSDLPKQERLLAGVAEATRQLLAIADFDTAVNGALEAIAIATEIDRIFIYQNHSELGTHREFASCPYEWTVTGVVKASELPNQFPLFYDEIDGYSDWLSELKAGQPVQKLAREMSEVGQDKQIQEQALSVLTVPIFVEGKYWGNFGFDDCTTERMWSKVEIAVLETAAASFAGALERQNNLAELERRDALLKSVNEAAQCLVATDELEQSIPQALKILGEGTKQDRVYVFKNLSDSKTGETLWDMPFEWNALGIPSASEYGMHLPIPLSAFPTQITKPLLNGQVFRYLVRDLDGMALDLNKEAQALSLVGVPFKVEGHLWGMLGFDDCTTEREWSEAEIAVLETAAACIGGAIERDNAHKDKEAAAQARVAELAERDRILEATAAAANVMLTEEDFDQAVKTALQIVGEGLEVDRINLGQYFEATSPNEVGYHDLSNYEWTSAKTILQAEHPEFSRISDTGMESQLEVLHRGEVFGGIVEEFPEPFRSSQLELGVKSTYAVPIRADGGYWGMIGLDDCQHHTRRSEAELEALITLANCIGNAIDREHERKAKEVAAAARLTELAERDRILEATAAAANLMFTDEDFDDAVNSALQIVGEGLMVDRIGLGKYTAAASPQEVGYHRLIYEWDSDGTLAQVEHAELAQISDEGIELYIDTLKRGEVFGGVVDEFREPFRSSQMELGVQSTYAVPIRINSQYWGLIGFDDCHAPTCRSEAEIEALRTLANCIGNAIDRERARKEREVAAQARAAELEAHNLELANRDRILEATAAAANVLLTDDDFEDAFNRALQIIGEAVGTDRVGLAQHLAYITEAEPGHWRLIHEWHAPGITPVAQIFYPEPMQGSYAGAEVLYEMHQRGEGFSLTTAQMLEPFRSNMATVGVQTLHAVPILLRDQYWGTVVFGDCRQQRQRSLAELAALQTVADCIGNAIDRDRNRKEREAATKARAVELKKNNEILSQRDRWLTATAAATEKLLSENDLKSAVKPALQEIGESIGVDRVGIMYAFERDGQQVLEIIEEWIHPSQPVQSENEELSAIPCHLIGEQHFKDLLNGQWYGGDIEDFPEPFCSSQKEIGVRSTYSVPIFIDGQFWGLVGIDHCREKKLLTQTEIAVFQTIASCFASAIQRDQIRKARETAERKALIEGERAARAAELEAANQVLTTRDRWLETTAIAANQLLSTADIRVSVNIALQTIGSNLDSDRLGVMRYFPDVTELGYFQVLYEWDAAGTTCQISNLELNQMPASDFADWTRRLMVGHPVGGPVEQQSEPFRSKMRSLGTLATYAVPIFIEAEFWGAVFMDYCRELRQLTPAELAVFKTAATCIGSAIHREQMRREREQAERDILLQQEREQAAQRRAATLEIYNRQLQQRDCLLNSVNAAAQSLVANEDLDAALPTMLKILGEGTAQCRAYILRNSQDEQTGELLFNLMLEWDAPHIPPKMEVGARFPVPIDHFPDHLTALLKAGRATQFLASELDGIGPAERQPGQALSLVGVPITVGGKWWGLLGLDDCIEERVWSDAEIAVLETAASAVGGALERDRTRQAREAAERTSLIEQERAARADELEAANRVLQTRERWLETTTTAANVLLSGTDVSASVNAALQTIGENLECDNVFVLQGIGKKNAPDELGFIQVSYEWFSEGQKTHIDIPKSIVVPAERFQESLQHLSSGQWIGGIVEELPEPIRSDQQALGVRSFYMVPVLLHGMVWGAVGIKHCHQAKRLSQEEISVFQTAAACIGSAIYQDSVRRDQAAQERAKLLGAVAEAANLLLRSADYTTVLPEVIRLVGEAVECDRCGIGQDVISPNSKKSAISIKAEWEWRSPERLQASEDFCPYGDKLFFWEDAPYITEELRKDEVVNILVADLPEPDRSFQSALGNLAECFVPITVEQKLWGFVSFDNCGEPRLYDEAEISILRVAAESIAAAIARQSQDEALRRSEQAILAEQEKAARERAAELAKTNEAIGRALVALTETPELGEFLGQILTQMQNQVEACKAHLFLYDEESDTLNQYMAVQNGQVYQGAAPTDPDIFRRPVPSKISSAWEMIVNSPKPFTLDEHHPEAAEAYWPESIPWHQAEGHLSSTCACMKVGGKPIGFIGFAFRHVAVLSDEQLEFIQALTNQATLSIHLTRLGEKAKQAAISQEQEKAAQERAAELAKANEAISNSLTTLAASPELDQFLGTIIVEMARQVGACKVHLYLYDPPTHTLNQRVAVQDGQVYFGRAPDDPDMFGYPIPADLTPGWEAIISAKHPLVYDETQPYNEALWWPESLVWHKAQEHKAITCMPLKAGETPIGYIGFAFFDRTFFSDEQLEFMLALANQATVAIQLTSLAEEAKQTAILQEQEKAARERAVELAKTNEAISKTLDALTTTPELNEFLGQILTQIIEQIGADDTHLFLYDAETHTLRSQLAVQSDTVYLGNAPGDPELFYTDIPADITAAWQILIKSGKPFTLDDQNPEAAEFLWPTTQKWHDARGHQSATCACMKIGNQPIGFIGFAFCDRTVLTNEQLEFVQALTNQATLAIHLTRLAEQARANALTDERNRLAREIHDTLAQAFTGISLQLEAAKNILVQQPETAKSYLDQARDLTRQGLSEARRSVHALRSQALETESLVRALQKSLTQMTVNTSLHTEFQIQGTPIPLAEGLQLNLLRIGQEAITNALRHAQAQTLTLTLTFTDQQVRLCIADDGVGFDLQTMADVAGFGLMGIRERTARYDGQVQINSHPGAGTSIEVTLPTKPKG
ncbi:GAF domain-containing protein [Acaryochloris marina NIES-2412]|uniref:GAF domain-containing protein n=1 Tax=Acaryochloris marina TaxID=155978 RepID=UPI0040594EF7